MPNGERDGHAWIVAVILALGLAIAICSITIAVLYDAIASAGPGLSENATQILTTAFGGIIGVLGGYLGYRAGRESAVEDRGASSNQTEPSSPTATADPPDPETSRSR